MSDNVKNSKLKAFLRVSRANLLLASIGHPAVGLFIGATSLNALFTWEVPFYIALHYSIAFFACNLNCLCDYKVDKHYKKYMSDSVDIIGRTNLKILILIEFLVSIAIIALFIINGYYIVSILGSIALIVVYMYSAEPFRIKKHGLLSPLPIIILYTLPALGGWLIYRNYLTLYFLLFLVGYVLMNEGFTLVNTCEDFSEDKKEGIKTWCHVLGLKKTLKIAFIFSISGILCIAGLSLKLYQNSWELIYLPALILIMFTTYLIIKASFEVRAVYISENLEKQSKIYGKKLQKWFLTTRYPLMIITLLLIM